MISSIRGKHKMAPLEDKNNRGFPNPKAEIITVKNVRILRPWEAKKLIDSIPKKSQRLIFEALLYSGMRYIEAQRLLEKRSMFEPNNKRIHLDNYAIRKAKIKMKERYVVLSPVGVRVIESFIDSIDKLTDYKTWTENLIRWANFAGISPNRIGSKTTRKTWESWLMTYYPHLTNHIFLSQGHNDMVALKHYVTIPFNDDDKNQMKEFVYGWEP